MEACKFQVADPCALRGLKLDRLTWCEGEFNDAWLSTLGSQGLPLTSLNLLDCDEITGEGLATWRTLTSLSLNGCKKFSDAGMVIAGSMTLLERLVLDQSKIFTSAGLGELWALSRLQHLSLKHCSQVHPCRPPTPPHPLQTTQSPVLPNSKRYLFPGLFLTAREKLFH